MYSGTVDGGWRGGRPLRELWKTKLRELPRTGCFGRMPGGLLEVLKGALENESVTMSRIVDQLLALRCTGMPTERPSDQDGIKGTKAVLMYDRIGAALFDRHKLVESLSFYESAAALGCQGDTGGSESGKRTSLVG